MSLDSLRNQKNKTHVNHLAQKEPEIKEVNLNSIKEDDEQKKKDLQKKQEEKDKKAKELAEKRQKEKE